MNSQDISLCGFGESLCYKIMLYPQTELRRQTRMEIFCYMFIDVFYFNGTQSLTCCLMKIRGLYFFLQQSFRPVRLLAGWSELSFSDGCTDCHIILYIISICCSEFFSVIPVRSHKYSPEINAFSLLFALLKSQFSSLCVCIMCRTQLWMHIWL